MTIKEPPPSLAASTTQPTHSMAVLSTTTGGVVEDVATTRQRRPAEQRAFGDFVHPASISSSEDDEEIAYAQEDTSGPRILGTLLWRVSYTAFRLLFDAFNKGVLLLRSASSCGDLFASFGLAIMLLIGAYCKGVTLLVGVARVALLLVRTMVFGDMGNMFAQCIFDQAFSVADLALLGYDFYETRTM